MRQQTTNPYKFGRWLNANFTGPPANTASFASVGMSFRFV